MGGTAGAVSSLINVTNVNSNAVTGPTPPTENNGAGNGPAAPVTVIQPTGAEAAVGALANISPSSGGSAPSGSGTGSPSAPLNTPTVADEAANYVVISSNTGPVTQQQPQSQGNVKTIIPNFSVLQPNGLTGGEVDKPGELGDVPSQ